MALTNTTSRTSRNGLITYGFDQSAAGSDDLVADPGDDFKIILVGFYLTMSAAGTLQLLEGTTVLGGTMDVATAGAVAWQGTLQDPLFELTESTKLAITTATGAASGFIIYRLVPSV